MQLDPESNVPSCRACMKDVAVSFRRIFDPVEESLIGLCRKCIDNNPLCNGCGIGKIVGFRWKYDPEKESLIGLCRLCIQKDDAKKIYAFPYIFDLVK